MADPNSRIDVRELAWAAGLFEGEGCITHNGAWGKTAVPKLVLCMCDEDSVVRFHSAIRGIGRIDFRPAKNEKHRPQWAWRVNGHERVQAVLAMLWFGFGQRRKARAKEILASSRPSHTHKSRRRRDSAGR